MSVSCYIHLFHSCFSISSLSLGFGNSLGSAYSSRCFQIWGCKPIKYPVPFLTPRLLTWNMKKFAIIKIVLSDKQVITINGHETVNISVNFGSWRIAESEYKGALWGYPKNKSPFCFCWVGGRDVVTTRPELYVFGNHIGDNVHCRYFSKVLVCLFGKSVSLYVSLSSWVC